MRRFRLVVAMLVAWVGLIEGQNQPPVFRVNADSVAVNVAVKKGNIPASGLVAQDFRVYDNDVLQRVEAVSQDAVPLDVSIVVDLSASAFRDLETPREAVRRMVSFLRPDDRFRILTMGVSVVNAVPWQLAGQPDVSGIQFVLGYRSLVADGVLVGLLYRSDPDRRHLVVALTDGQDICSVTSGESLRRAAERSGAVFHWVNLGLGAQPFKSFARSNGVEVDCNHKGAATDLGSVLSNATRLTGGSVHDASRLLK
jgi:hypothetical protein